MFKGFKKELVTKYGAEAASRIWNKANAEYAQKWKEEGKIKHLGFSFHDSPEVLDQILTEHPEVEFVQIIINYFDWNSYFYRIEGLL